MKYRELELAVAVRRAVVLATMVSAMAACGGGGGGGGGIVKVDPPPAALPPPVVYTANPQYSGHITLTNTAPAHAAGLSGAGVRIGIVDSGANRNHPALQGRVTANLVYISSTGNNLAVDDVVGHGTAVAQVAAGTAFGEWPGGIAPGAQIVSARIISDKPPSDDGSGQGNEVDGALGLKSIHQDLINRGVRIMNNSWGGLYWTNLNATAPIADEYRPFIMSNGGLVVFATGNEGGANPSSMAALPSQPGPNGSMPAADLERGWLAVTAVDPANIHSLDRGSDGVVYANACGIAMRYCLAAPGTVIATGTNDLYNAPNYWRWKGTSFAAPQVSGAAALVWQKFPYFSNDLLRQTLLGTAKDIGAVGVDPEFGYGLLDVGAAVLGPARFDWGDVVVSFTGTSAWGNAISGAGGLVKQGSGRLELTRPNVYQGATQVQQGTLASYFTVPGDAFVSAGANLELRGGVSGSLDNLGTVTSLTASAHAVAGNYHHGANARFAFEIGAPLQVAGQATIDGGDAQVTGIAQGYTRSSRETVLTAAGGVNGRFATLSSGSGVFLQATLGYDPTNIWLDIARLDVTAAAAAMGFSGMSLAAAERVEEAFSAIDRGVPPEGHGGEAGSTFLEAAGMIQRSPTAMAAQRTLESLSGALHGADTMHALMAIEGSRHALESRLDNRGSASAGGAWWDRLGAQHASGQQFGIDSQGWVQGHDVRLANGWTVGGALAETTGRGFQLDRGDRERNRQVEGQVYGQWQAGDTYLLARMSHGMMERQARRDVFLGDAVFGVDSDYANQYTTLGLQLGQRFVGKSGNVVPYAGVQSLQMTRGGFSEEGAAGFGLRTDSSTYSELQALAGVRFDRHWGAGATRWWVDGRFEWQRTLSQSGVDISARFTGIDVWSPIRGERWERDAGILGLGLGAKLRRMGLVRMGFDMRQHGLQRGTQAQLEWAVGF
ncbi:S8 family serine peptidase [Lysobacter olei]